jgi:hypothetical protein
MPGNNTHENRETSPLPEGTGRSVKALDRTTDMNDGEESDSGIVPMKDSNERGRKSVRRSPEGRPPSKENTWSNARPRRRAGNKTC